jgi:hypothetical protein
VSTRDVAGERVEGHETVSRFILQDSWIRENGTVRGNAFHPHPKRLDLSVTRTDTLADEEIWAVGRQVANSIPKTLHGRVDVRVSIFDGKKLRTIAVPVEGNPNHADVVDWPTEVCAYKMLAKELSELAPKPLRTPRE